MTSVGLWVPGPLTPTNEALSLVRGAGYHAGYGKAMCETGRWRSLRHGEDAYASTARMVRQAAALAARRAGIEPFPRDVRVRLRVAVHGYDRWDAAAAYLSAKWIEDGIVDAGVLGSDRFNVAECAVSVVRSELSPRAGAYVSLAVVS